MADSLTCAGEAWETYDRDDCNTAASGIGSAVLFKAGVNPDDVLNEGGTQIDVTKMQALVNAGDATIITGVQMSIEPPTAITVPTYRACDVENRPVGYDRVLNLKDPKVSAQNVSFYNSINAVNNVILGGALLLECNADRITYVDAAIRATGGRVSPEALDAQRFEFTLSYRQNDDAPIYPNNDAIWTIVPAS